MAVIEYLVTILVVILSFFLVICFHIRNKNSPIPNWPLIGMLPSLVHNRSRIHEYASSLMNQHSNTLNFKGPWFANFDFVVTSDPANVQHILTKNFSNYGKGSSFKDIFDVLGDGIFASESDWWKQQKRLTQSVLAHAKFQQLWEKTIKHKVKNDLFPILDHVSASGMEIDLQDLFQRFTFDISCITVFGFDPGFLSLEFPDMAVAKSFHVAEESLLYRHTVPQWLWKLQTWLQIGREKDTSRARETLEQFVAQQIPLFRCRCREVESFDMLTCFINQIEDFQVTDKFLRDTIINNVAAGKDSTSSALTWFFYLLAETPSVEVKIREEMKASFLQDDKFLTSEETKKMIYLHGAVCESLRLYPPVPFNHKASIRPDVLPSGHTIHANTMILIPIYAMGRNQEIWGQDCLEFKPERWITKQGEIAHVPSHKFMPFNAGPRTCLGKDISLFLLKQVATAIIWNYQIDVIQGHPVLPSNSIVLSMQHGLKVRVNKRHF